MLTTMSSQQLVSLPLVHWFWQFFVWFSISVYMVSSVFKTIFYPYYSYPVEIDAKVRRRWGIKRVSESKPVKHGKIRNIWSATVQSIAVVSFTQLIIYLIKLNLNQSICRICLENESYITLVEWCVNVISVANEISVSSEWYQVRLSQVSNFEF